MQSSPIRRSRKPLAPSVRTLRRTYFSRILRCWCVCVYVEEDRASITNDGDVLIDANGERVRLAQWINLKQLERR